jgi:hypothetical protein
MGPVTFAVALVLVPLAFAIGLAAILNVMPIRRDLLVGVGGLYVLCNVAAPLILGRQYLYENGRDDEIVLLFVLVLMTRLVDLYGLSLLKSYRALWSSTG